MVQSFLDGRVMLHGGDCLEVMAGLPDCSVDSIVCDPPYHLTAGKKGGTGVASLNENSPAGRARISTGFMGKAWDGGDIAFRPETWAHALRILKPGGHLVAFSGTRTYHRMTVAIEDAGFEIRDMICWHYGSGFPKSHNVSKGMDKAAGAKREVIGMTQGNGGENLNALARPGGKDAVDAKGSGAYGVGAKNITIDIPITATATDAAKQWDGYGTALKPATEPICLARKPLIGTVVENVLQHGTGALNIDGCRIETGDSLGGGMVSKGRPKCSEGWDRPWMHDEEVTARKKVESAAKVAQAEALGRWPANLIHDGSPEVMALFPESSVTGARSERSQSAEVDGTNWLSSNHKSVEHTDSGSAARFFYTAKADADDRLGSKHPTVKPLDLMQWLVRLVCPKGGTVLDPFAGTGSTGEAAWREGMSAILIERELEYQADIARRMELATNPTKRAAVAKTKNNLDRPEDLPLFAER